MLAHKKSSVHSKQGFALATVIVVSCVIVILATSLIGIAIASIQSTSGNIDERQAYLNAKSALDYSAEYYNDGGTLPELASGTTTGEEYILMRDMEGGTSTEGADVVSVTADTTGYKTYVHTLYDQSAATLTLRAYAKSSDAFGGKPKSTTLAVTYKLGSGGGRVGRQLPTTPASTTMATNNDDVTIHVRRDPNATGNDYFNPAIYTWSYYQKNKKTGLDYTSVISSAQNADNATTNFNNIPVNAINNIESEGNKFEPAGRWVSGATGDATDGPVTKMDPEVGSNDWFTHTFSPSAKAEENGGAGAKMVPWFNMIVSRQGKGVGNKANGSQSCEFLNVWYFDEADKNIYVEVLKSPLYYYNETSWNGKTNLEGRLIAYANAPQTVYYVKLEGKNDNSLNPSISVTGSSGSFGSGAMTYSGYGWWSFRSTASKTDSPTVTVTTGGSTITVPSVTSGEMNSIMNRTAYIVIDASGSARTFIDEKAAAIAMGDEDYVTVYAKAYKNNSISNPKISYLVETHSDSAAKQKLKNAIDDADLLYKADYTTDSWDNFIATLNNAKSVYNNSTLQPNSVYNTEVINIQNAKSALTFKPVDTTKLEQLIAQADSKAEADYTNETYSAMRTIRNQAQTLVDDAKKGNATVSQKDIEQKAALLKAKIDALDLIAPYREALNNKISDAETAAAENPTSPELGSLNNAINAARALLSSNSKTDIENAISNLVTAIYEVKVGDPTELISKITAAKNIITNDSSILVPGTLQNLQNVVNTVEAKLNGATLTQNQINKYTASVEDAVNKLVYAPEDNTIPKVATGKKRIWFDLSKVENGSDFYLYAWRGAGTAAGDKNVSFIDTPGGWSRVPSVKLTQDAATGYYYYDLEDKFTDFIVVRNDTDVIHQTDTTTYDENNNFIIVNGLRKQNASGKAPETTKAKLTTVFVEKDSPWASASQYAYVRSSANSSLNTSSLTADRFSVTDGSGKYYVKRIAFDASSKFYIHNGNNSGNNRTVDIQLELGTTVVLYPKKSFDPSDNVTVDKDTLEKIMKRKPTTAVKASGNVNVSDSKYTGKSVSVNKTSTAGTFVDSAVPSDPVVTVYFKKPSADWSDIRAEVCQLDDSNNAIDGTTQGNLKMITIDENYYSIKLDASRVNAITISDAASGSRKTSRLKLALNSSGKYHNVQLISEKSGGGYKISMYTASQVSISTTDVTFTDKDKPMAFVGGKKQVFTNVADTRSGRKDMCGRYLSGNFSNSNDKGYGYARVGQTSYSTYYDWYEYKIPAGSTDLYTFQIKGLNKSEASVSTKQVHQVWGDVWVTLTSTAEKENGKYKALINTVNPEDNVTQEKTTVYVTQNTDLISNHGGMQVTMWGTEMKTEKLTNVYDGRYYIEVPQSMPFLQFSSVDGSTIYSMTKLQGGDKILYDYSAGAGGTPTWLTYVPANIALQRERANAESVGRGWTLFNYNVSTHKVTETIIPLALNNMADKDASINQSKDPVTDQNRANLLAKWTIAYMDLYQEISNARMYLTIDNNGNSVWYPENDGITSGASYSTDSIKELYTIVKDATIEYGSASASYNNLVSYAEQIKTKISDLEPDITQKAVLILEDVAGWNNNIQVRYVDASGTTVTKMVSSTNTAGNPMIFVDADPEITNVQFGYGIGSSIVWGSAQPVIKAEQAYVYNNSSQPTIGGWSLNSVENYFTISSSHFTQNNASEEKLVGDKATEEDFVLYFKYNTKVTYKESAGVAERTYVIPAGAYAINMPTFKTYYTGAGTAPDKVNLYSRMAEDYFTKLENQGMSPTGADSDTLGWTSSGDIVNHASLLQCNRDVNFIATSGALNGLYSLSGIFSFRWNGDSDCYVNSGTMVTASSFTFACPEDKIITAGSSIAPTFILRNSSTDPEAKTQFTFLTNTEVSYKDASGEVKKFPIFQGTYEAVNSGDANFFDEEFWKSGVKLVEAGGSGSGSYLSDPVYSTD